MADEPPLDYAPCSRCATPTAWRKVDADRWLCRKCADEPPFISGPNLLGVDHVHDYSTPWRGYLLCADDMCGSVVSVDGQPLTLDQSNAIAAELRKEYGSG